MQPATAPLIPLPPHVEDALRVNWHLTLWCNYSCQYCPVLVFHQRSASGAPREHSFDHYPVERWLEALSRFKRRRIHLKITGGEPFLDRKNFRALLCGLAEMKHIRVGIDTNGYWDAAYYDGFDKSGIFLNVSYHPSQCGFPEFLKRLRAIRASGFTVAMVNYIVAPENMDAFEDAFSQLEAEGFCVNASTMVQTGVYLSRTERTDRELDLLVRYNMPIDLEFKLLQPKTKGRMCFYPAMTYYIRFDGKIRVGCMDEYQDLFTDGIPPLPQGAVPCPQQQCENCTDMYRALIDEPLYPKPVQLYTLEDYAREFSEYRREQNVDDPEFRKRAVAYWYGRVDERRRSAEAALPVIRTETAAEVPAAPIFGYVDARDGKFYIEARSRDRVWVSGWAVSTRHGAPVRELVLRVDGHQIAVIRDFHPRPDVAAHFGRPDFLHCGWQALVYLPALKPGEHELIAEATAPDGIAGVLPPWLVKITE